jgi:hypothetical protein
MGIDNGIQVMITLAQSISGTLLWKLGLELVYEPDQKNKVKSCINFMGLHYKYKIKE